jgi:hypothetical protein
MARSSCCRLPGRIPHQCLCLRPSCLEQNLGRRAAQGEVIRGISVGIKVGRGGLRVIRGHHAPGPGNPRSRLATRTPRYTMTRRRTLGIPPWKGTHDGDQAGMLRVRQEVQDQGSVCGSADEVPGVRPDDCCAGPAPGDAERTGDRTTVTAAAYGGTGGGEDRCRRWWWTVRLAALPTARVIFGRYRAGTSCHSPGDGGVGHLPASARFSP